MIIHESRQSVPEAELTDLGDPADLGRKVLDGDPRISARIGYSTARLPPGSSRPPPA